MLYYAILYYTIYSTILYYTILYYTILYYTILYYTILYYTILYYTILYYTILYYTILYYTILYYTILYYTILYYTILYYTILDFADLLLHIGAASGLKVSALRLSIHIAATDKIIICHLLQLIPATKQIVYPSDHKARSNSKRISQDLSMGSDLGSAF